MKKAVKETNNIALSFSNLAFNDSDEHINKMPYSGICLLADTPSDGVPCGSDKPVAFSTEAITKALDSFVGMGVNCVYSEYGYPEYALTGHDTRFKIGVVEEASLTTDGVFIKGSLWKRDFNDVCFQIKNAKDSLGFSIEVCVNDMEDTGDSYLVKDFSFTGVAILYKNLAAFKSTQLAAQRMKESDERMTQEQYDKLMEFAEKATAALDNLNARLEAIENKETKFDFSEVIDAVNGLGEKMEAKEVAPPAPKTAGMTFAKKLDNQEALALSEKCKEIDSDVSIPSELKASKKLEAWKASLKQSE